MVPGLSFGTRSAPRSPSPLVLGAFATLAVTGDALEKKKRVADISYLTLHIVSSFGDIGWS